MKRTNADGNASNLFTDGNPGTGVPATVVDASWLNAVQEEIAKVIEGAGLALDGLSTGAQLVAAIQLLVQNGALWANLAIGNNQVAAANLAGLLFNKANEYGAEILYHLYRKTDTGGSEVVQEGKLYARYKPVADAWDLVDEPRFDDAGVTFSITSAGQIQYVSTNIAGTNHVGELRVTDVKKIRKA
jgi:hypothetical protein